MIIQLPESSPAPKIEILDDPKISVSEKENLNQSQNPMGEKENASETGKAEPEMKKDIHPERMYFWNKMIWEEKESLVERQQLYHKTTNFLKQQFL